MIRISSSDKVLYGIIRHGVSYKLITVIMTYIIVVKYCILLFGNRNRLQVSENQ